MAGLRIGLILKSSGFVRVWRKIGAVGTRRPTIMLGSGGDAVGPGEFEALDDAWGVDGGHDDGAKAEVFAAGGAQDPQDGGHVLGSGIEAVELLLPFADAGGHGFEVVLEGAAELFFEHFHSMARSWRISSRCCFSQSERVGFGDAQLLGDLAEAGAAGAQLDEPVFGVVSVGGFHKEQVPP